MNHFKRALGFALGFAFLVGTPAQAGYRASGDYGDIDIGGYLRSTNIVRHPDLDRLSFIMQRNSAKLKLEWKFLQRGKSFGRTIPWLDRGDLVMITRGVFDSLPEFTPGSNERKDLQGDPLSFRDVSLDSVDAKRRNNTEWQWQWREAYLDLYFKKLPFSLRIGKQQVVWGETDGFRMLDRANTLDLSWHFFQELPPPGFGFDELRIPFFMIKGLWDFGQLGNLSQPFLEFYWNPGDWVPGKIAFLPSPWGVRLLNPISNAKNTGVLQSQTFCGNAAGAECESLFKGTRLFRQGDYKRTPLDNSQFGIRFHFITENGFEWSLNYLYQRMSPDGSPTAIVRGIPEDKMFTVPGFGGVGTRVVSAAEFCDGLSRDPTNAGTAFINPWAANQICIEYFAPYIHTLGVSLNYFEGEYTQTVFRLETVIDFDLPFYDGDKRVALFGRAPNSAPLLPGISERNMWKGMLAFDRPTWIKSLNKQTTFFITGQLFWHYIINHERRRCARNDDPSQGYTSSPSEQCGSDSELLLPGEQLGLIGPLDLPKLDSPGGRFGVKFRDSIHQWEVLGTLAILGFYKGGTLVPAMIYLIDPVNSLSQELAVGFDWFFTPDLSLNLTTRLIWAGLPWNPYEGHSKASDVDNGEIFDPWFLGGGSRGRSETSFQFTWQY